MLRRIRIDAYQVGLVLRNKELIRVITEGNYWIKWNEHVLTYRINDRVYETENMDYWLKNESLAAMLQVYTVKNNEIALVYKNGLYEALLTSGRYIYWKANDAIRLEIINLDQMELSKEHAALVKTNGALRAYTLSIAVKEYEKVLLLVNEKYEKMLETGNYVYWSAYNNLSVLRADMRKIQLEISGQEILTKDKAAIRLNMYAEYKVAEVETALLKNKDYEKQLYVYLQLALREYVGTMTLDELLANKNTVSDYVLTSVSEKAKTLGLSLVSAGLRDIILTGEMKEIMNKVLIAEKQAQANTIARREETAATRSLLNTAKLMEENAMLWKLKEMEYMEKIAEKIGEITVNGNGDVLSQLKQLVIK